MQKGREGAIITSARHRSCLRGDTHGGGKLPTFSSRPRCPGKERCLRAGEGERREPRVPGREPPLSLRCGRAALLSSVLTWGIESGAQLYKQRPTL